jgi:hypothetical protein
MKIVIKLSKPRNPFAVASRRRPGHAHGSVDPAKRARRAGKRDLQRTLTKNFEQGE